MAHLLLWSPWESLGRPPGVALPFGFATDAVAENDDQRLEVFIVGASSIAPRDTGRTISPTLSLRLQIRKQRYTLMSRRVRVLLLPRLSVASSVSFTT